MPYLTCIGAHGVNIRQNVGSFGSRGYWILRKRRIVYIRWGPIRSTLSRSYTLRWARPWQELKILCSSEARARKTLADYIAKRMRPSEGYTLLPRGIKIQ
jgi:hypothetical protein